MRFPSQPKRAAVHSEWAQRSAVRCRQVSTARQGKARQGTASKMQRRCMQTRGEAHERSASSSLSTISAWRRLSPKNWLLLRQWLPFMVSVCSRWGIRGRVEGVGVRWGGAWGGWGGVGRSGGAGPATATGRPDLYCAAAAQVAIKPAAQGTPGKLPCAAPSLCAQVTHRHFVSPAVAVHPPLGARPHLQWDVNSTTSTRHQQALAGICSRVALGCRQLARQSTRSVCFQHHGVKDREHMLAAAALCKLLSQGRCAPAAWARA